MRKIFIQNYEMNKEYRNTKSIMIVSTSFCLHWLFQCFPKRIAQQENIHRKLERKRERESEGKNKKTAMWVQFSISYKFLMGIFLVYEDPQLFEMLSRDLLAIFFLLNNS